MAIKYRVDESGQIIRENYQDNNTNLIEVNTVNGIKRMSEKDIIKEVENGARFITYSYVYSLILMSFKRYSDIYLVKPGESAFGKVFGYFILTLLVGWWGFPWGIFWTLGSLFDYLTGGIDVTDEIIVSVNK